MWIRQSFVIKYKTNFVYHDVYHKPLISFYSFKKFTYKSLLLTVIEKNPWFFHDHDRPLLYDFKSFYRHPPEIRYFPNQKALQLTTFHDSVSNRGMNLHVFIAHLAVFEEI
jgi:hypothetical protein